MSGSPGTRWLAVFAALFAGVVGACAFGKMSPALPLLKSEFGLSLIEAGWLVSAFNALAAAGAIFFGAFADRVGALRFCVSGVVLIGLSSALGALASGAGGLIALRLLACPLEANLPNPVVVLRWNINKRY